MRTKTILLSAAVFAAGIGISTAQSVYSINAVGYVNLTIVNGYNLIANPLNGTNNNINTIMPTAPDGSLILRWNPGSQQFAGGDNYFSGFGWLDAGFTPSTTVINPGEGFFFQNNSGSPTTLTFVGEVPQGNLTNRIVANYGFYSSQVPQSGTLTSLGFPGQDGMAYLAWNPATQSYCCGYNFLAGNWYDELFTQVDPAPTVGQGFVIQNPGSPVNWTRTFSVNN
jgi:hypothetical protein